MENTERLDDFRACFDDSPQPSCIIEMLKDDHGNFADFRFVYLNRALARLEGFDAEYVNGKCFYKLFDTPTASGWAFTDGRPLPERGSPSSTTVLK